MSVYGIDLGTTYSCIAKLDNAGNPVIIKNFDDNSDWVASAVYFKEGQDQCIVGEGAKEASLIYPGRVVEYAKRYIGRVKELTRNFEIDGKVYKPEDISAIVLKRIVTYARSCGEDVQDVIITCPAYFDFAQREATKLAGTYAGLNVIDTVNEPTAAALSYCHRQFEEDQTILIYDLGGGTFDVSILRMSLDPNGRQILTVLATTGDDRLGGKEWDDMLFKIMVNRYCAETNIEYSEKDGPAQGALELETLQLIKNSVETLKKKLSFELDSSIKVNDAGIRTTIRVNRQEFEEKTGHLVDRTMGYLDQALILANNPDIDLVLLVGGSTFMPKVREVLEARFPGLVRLEDPNLAVAKGAAILGSMLDIGRDWEKIAAIIEAQKEAIKEKGIQKGLTKDQLVTEVKEELKKQGIIVPDAFDPEDYAAENRGQGSSAQGGLPPILEETAPRSLGPAVLVNDEYLIDNLVKMGDKLPVQINKPYYTPRDNMTQIRLPLYQSMSREEYVVPDVYKDGTKRETDPALDVKRFEKYLILPLPQGMPADSEIWLDFQVTKSDVTMKVRNPMDNTEKNVKYSFYEEVSEEEIKKKQQELNSRQYVSDI